MQTRPESNSTLLAKIMNLQNIIFRPNVHLEQHNLPIYKRNGPSPKFSTNSKTRFADTFSFDTIVQSIQLFTRILTVNLTANNVFHKQKHIILASKIYIHIVLYKIKLNFKQCQYSLSIITETSVQIRR